MKIWGYFIHWPPSSPDSNPPIENLWLTIKDHIHKRNPFPTTFEALRQAIQEEWDAISLKELEFLVHSVSTRGCKV